MTSTRQERPNTITLRPIARRTVLPFKRIQWFTGRSASLIFVLSVALAIVSVIDHATVVWLRIRTGGIDQRHLATLQGAPVALAQGSSLMLDAISWQRVANSIRVSVENWFVAGSSPSEWEVLQHRARDVHLTFIAVSAYDLNEDFLCDYRADVVPLDQTINDLRQSHSDWQFSKRVLSQYPLKYVRLFFPTMGRSDGVMVGLRGKLAKLLSPWMKIETEAGPAIHTGNNEGTENAQTEKLTHWAQARTLRRIALMRSACGGKQRFDGPKKVALLRMLKQAHRQGDVVVIVLPVSNIYTREFLPSPVIAQFEASLSAARQAVPAARWFRLDQLPELNSDNNFWDLVHLNLYGQQIATKAFLEQLDQTLPSTQPR
jgi:hypothetical protein